jgi:hypothetical protein
LAEVYQGQSEFLGLTGKATRKNFAEHLKYYSYEAESLRELIKEREAVKYTYVTQEKALIAKKEKLWKVKDKDITKWGFDDILALEKIKDQLFKDKDLAFSYMYYKESIEVDKRREEMSFFTNQCWDELRRVSEDNGEILREHYVEMAQLMG